MIRPVALLSLALVLAPFAPSCRVVPNPDCPDVTVGQMIENAQQNARQSPTNRGQACGPTLAPLGLADVDGGACAAEAGDDPCVLCGKVSCCAEAEACVEDPSCNPGTDAFDGLVTCLRTQCAKECPT